MRSASAPFKIPRLITILGPWDGCLRESEVSKRLTDALGRASPSLFELMEKYIEQLYSNIGQESLSEMHLIVKPVTLTTQFPRLNVVGWLSFHTWLSIVMDAWASGHVLEAEYSRSTGTPTIFINAFHDDALDKLCYVSGIGLEFEGIRNTIGKLVGKEIGLISPKRQVDGGLRLPMPRNIYGTGMLRDFAGTLFVRMLVERSLYCSCLCHSKTCMEELEIKDKGLEELVCDERSLGILSRCLQVALYVLLEQFIARSGVMDLIPG